MAFVLNITYDSSVDSAPNPTGIRACGDYVKAWFESNFTNNVTVPITLTWTSLSGGAIAATSGTPLLTNYAALRAALIGVAAPGSSSMPSSDPFSTGFININQAQARALSIGSPSGSDGTTHIGSTASWDFTASFTVTPSGGAYPLASVLWHEITEILGRISGANGLPTFCCPMDYVRYTGSHARCTTVGASGSNATVYFSIDDGVTPLGTWNNDPAANKGDLGDWRTAPLGGGDACLAIVSSGTAHPVSSVDVTNMQALGWLTATAPLNTQACTVSGATAVSSPITCTPGTWAGQTPITLSYQWKSGATNVGTNSTAYTTVSGDAGNLITCVESATNAAGGPITQVSSNNVGPVGAAAPVYSNGAAISGTVNRGQTLTAAHGSWTNTPTSYAYQWKSNNVNVGTGTTYLVDYTDVGHTLTVTVTATNPSGSASQVSGATAIIPAEYVYQMQF